MTFNATRAASAPYAPAGQAARTDAAGDGPSDRPRATAEVIAFPSGARAGATADCDIQQVFSHYVSPKVVERLMADPRLLNLGGETREITVMFADVRGFSALAESMQDDPQRLARVVNAILCPLSEIVMAHGGTIDKYMGDCVMAFWGAPFDDADHAQHAVDAARAMLDEMWTINQRLRELFAEDGEFPAVSIGIGVNTGNCVVGNMGSKRRFDYSVIGDPVNVASRLEGLCKSYGAPLLIGEATARKLHRTMVFEVDRIQVRGRNGVQSVFTVG